MAAALLLMLLTYPALLMLQMSPAAAADTYEQESRRMFVEWKAKMEKPYEDAGEEECRYAVFKNARRRVARANADGANSGLFNSLSDRVVGEEITRVRIGERSFEEETRRMFVAWKDEHGKSYRDAGEEDCRYKLFKANRRVVVKLNVVAAGEAVYGLNEFGDLTNEEVRDRCDGRGGEEMERKLSSRWPGRLPVHFQGTETEYTESGASGIPGDEAQAKIH
uniref:Cathepsin propeptide inhibitor domain-containing protein n=1 Tax=Leersia perrieri TaxID=77586 RepID=A0A0D9V8Q2_9ORYZ